MLRSSSVDSVQHYRDIDYDSFRGADFDSEAYWTLLPAAEQAALEHAREEKPAKERI